MYRITFATVLAVLLFGSFFMPFFYWNSFEMNGFNFILSDHTPPYKYFLLLIPIVTILYLSIVLSEENSSYSRKLLSWIPITTLVAVFILILITPGFDPIVFENGKIFSNTGAGFWLALSTSILLVFGKTQPKRQYHS